MKNKIKPFQFRHRSPGEEQEQAELEKGWIVDDGTNKLSKLSIFATFFFVLKSRFETIPFAVTVAATKIS
jgi:hypothetical protein